MPIPLLTLLVALTAGIFGCDRKPPIPENLILITVDTLRADRIGAYGKEGAGTPNLDALASSGTTFTRAYAPMGRTTPALASMMTGLWPHHHGSREVGHKVERGTFLATHLKGAGFATIGITANRLAGKKQGFSTDFDVFEEHPNDASVTTDRAVEAVGNVSRDTRLFLWAHYYDPHWPYSAPKPWRRAGTEACTELEGMSRGARESNHAGESARALSVCSSAYQGEVSFADHEIGRLVRALDGEGRLRNALVVVTSDHGENLGEDGTYYAHGLGVHDAELRIPLIFSGPGIPKNRRRTNVVRLEDLPSTLLSILSVPERSGLSGPQKDGRDFTALFRSSRDHGPETFAFAESGSAFIVDDYRHLFSGRPRMWCCLNSGSYSLCWNVRTKAALYDRIEDPEMKVDLRLAEPEHYAVMMRAKDRWPPGSVRSRSVNDGRFKLVERPKLEGGYERVLWDLAADPAEFVDVRDRYPNDYVRLRNALEKWTEGVPGYVHEALSDEEAAQLRALGYIE